MAEKGKQTNDQHAPGLGVATVNPPTTSTYKRAQARRKRKFDAWWYGNNPEQTQTEHAGA